MTIFKTTADFKKWAVNKWLTDNEYFRMVTFINSLTINGGYEEAVDYLTRRHIRLKKERKSYIGNIKGRTHPFIMSTEDGLVIKLAVYKNIEIQWIEVIKYCKKRYKDLSNNNI